MRKNYTVFRAATSPDVSLFGYRTPGRSSSIYSLKKKKFNRNHTIFTDEKTTITIHRIEAVPLNSLTILYTLDTVRPMCKRLYFRMPQNTLVSFFSE